MTLAVKRDFPRRHLEKVVLLTPDGYAEQWTIKGKRPLLHRSKAYYDVRMSGPGDKLKAVYTPDGELLHLREVIQQPILPQPVADVLAQSYAGWELADGQERITDGKGLVELYYLTLKKGKNTEKLVMDPEGTILRKNFRHQW